MPGRIRIESKIGCYHVIQRGVAKQILFEDERDYRCYYERMRECVRTFGCEIVAYCLMNNHVHLLIRSSDSAEVSRMMQKLGTGYAKYFNTKYDRSGHVFQGRFHSISIQSEQQLLACVRYIHNNPVKAKYCKAHKDYEWSSYREYIGKSDVVKVKWLLKIVGGIDEFMKLGRQRDNYKVGLLESTDAIMARGQEIINEQLGYKYDNGFIVNQLSKPVRDGIIYELQRSGMTRKQIELLTGVSKTIQKRVCQSRGQRVQNVPFMPGIDGA